MLNDLLKRRYTGLLISLFVLTVVYIPVCYSDYAFLDEAHQLWNNDNHSNYSMFLVQGRWLSGVLFDKVFSSVNTIADLKYIRVFSFLSWGLFLLFYFRFCKKWRTLFEMDNLLLVTMGAYIACSLSVAVYVGWASCFQCGIANLLGLCSGHMMFTELINKNRSKAFSIVLICLSGVMGIASLFLYQTAFGTFLIPFVLYFISKGLFVSKRLVLIGLSAYLLISVIYYKLFLISIQISGVTASARTTFSNNIADKLGFFFGYPFAQAYSLNFLYNTHSVLSQLFPFVMIALWLFIYFRSSKEKAIRKILFIVGFIVIGIFIYLPLLVANENFSSYRTMFALNLAASFLVIHSVMSILKSERTKAFFTILLIAGFTIVALWNFRLNYLIPLKFEYKSISSNFDRAYHSSIDSVCFLAPPENGFYKSFGVKVYKDEFGLPSTYKDWTPSPLIKQLIYEKSNNRQLAKAIEVMIFTDSLKFADLRSQNPNRILFFNITELLKN